MLLETAYRLPLALGQRARARAGPVQMEGMDGKEKCSGGFAHTFYFGGRGGKLDAGMVLTSRVVPAQTKSDPSVPLAPPIILAPAPTPPSCMLRASSVAGVKDLLTSSAIGFRFRRRGVGSRGPRANPPSQTSASQNVVLGAWKHSYEISVSSTVQAPS